MVCDLLIRIVNIYNLYVLILVLMEYGLRHKHPQLATRVQHSLNPCFNGIWSATTSHKLTFRSN